MEEKKFYTSRIYMFVIIIFFTPFLIMTGEDIYSSLGVEMNGRLWARLVLLLLFEIFFLYTIVYSFKQLINPTLLITVTETGVIVDQDKRNVEIGWEDIESYMICGKAGAGGVAYFYIFLKDGIAFPTIPKQNKIEFHFKTNKNLRRLSTKRILKNFQLIMKLLRTLNEEARGRTQCFQYI